MFDDDRDYYHRRAAQERKVATASDNAVAVLIHLQLAEAYDARVLATPLISNTNSNSPLPRH